jgi:CRP/FNR family transcriptional regulator, cyclic AMP receptor protein
MENLRSTVAEHAFCKDLEPAYIDLLTGCASNVRFEAGQRLFRQGGQANQFFLIREGKVALETVAPERGNIIVEMVGEGEVLGWAWLVPPYRWHFTACAEGLVRAIKMDGKCLRTKCQKNHDLGYELLRRTIDIVGKRLEATRFRLLDLYSAEMAESRPVFI